MSENHPDTPCASSAPPDEKTKPLFQKIAAMRWWRGMFIVGLISLLLTAVIWSSLFLGGKWFSYSSSVYLVTTALFFSVWVGVPVSLAASFVTTWWRLGKSSSSFGLLFLNMLCLAFNFLMIVGEHC